MKTQNRFYKITGAIAILGFLAGCGAQAYREGDNIGQGQTDGGYNDPTPEPTPTPTSPTSGSSAVTESFSITGNGTFTSTAVFTDNLLKVRIKPNTAPTVSGTGYTPVYNCVSYQITVLGQTIRTQTFKVGSNSSVACPNAVTEQTIDFSPRLTPGHNEITIKMDAVQTDWKYLQCLTNSYMWLYPMTSYFSCESYGRMNNLYTTHTATGLLEIQVNGTTL